ncbi:MAG: ABC transporter permease [Dorea sp.]|nr:ABC transporter permease [Dorea sp.]
MLGKLAVRNVKRSARDYLVYVITMTFVAALMFAFNSIIFSPDIRERVDAVGIMAALVGLATFFVVIIVTWLINYMVRFMLEKRSREFGTYLLLGMRTKEISRLYMRENVLMGTGAFFAGLVFGILLQQILMAVLYSMIQLDYELHLEFNRWCILMTAGCFWGCYFLALFRCKGRFKKMNICDLMHAGNKNEEIRESHEKGKRWLLFLAVIFLFLFGLWLFFGGLLGGWNGGTIIGFIVGLVLTIYLFYTGLSASIICYIREKKEGIYKGQNLFLLRQLSSKIKTMRFTMGTITALFMLAFLGCTVAMMFGDYQNKILKEKFPFDVQVYSADVEDDFKKELEVIKDEAKVKYIYPYHIYTDGTAQVNSWLYTHLREFGTMYLKKDGKPDDKALAARDDGCYCEYDTYMKLSDYNHLREMLGYEKISLKEDGYAIHIKKRVLKETGDFSGQLKILGKKGELVFSGYHTEAFSQDGHNGGDYVIVVPDEACDLAPYYAELAVDIEGEAPGGLARHLDELDKENGSAYMDWSGDKEGEEEEDSDTLQGPNNSCCGSDTIVSYAAVNLVRDNVIPEVKYILSSIVFPCFYIGLVFVCIALTVLSVQQLSDSAKYRFRYGVLKKIGLSKREISDVVKRQLIAYYLCPALFAAVIAGIISVFISRKFIFYTGIETHIFQYFGISFLLFFGIYILYFVTTYVEFKRNIENEM